MNPTEPARRVSLALPLLLLGATAIGLAPIFVRYRPVGLSATAAWRLLLAVPLLAAPLGLRRPGAARPRRRVTGRDLLLLTLPGLLFAGDLGFWHQSIALTSVANATFFTNCAPIFVAAASWVWLGERVGRSYLAGLVLALTGALLLLTLKPQAFLGRQGLLGDGLGVVSAVFYAGYQISASRLRQRFSTLAVMTVSSFVSGVILLAVAALAGETMLPISLGGWLILLALALVSQVGGQGLIVYALGHLPASFASVSLLFQCIVAAAAGFAILHEPVGPWQAVGGALVLAGIFLARQGSAK